MSKRTQSNIFLFLTAIIWGYAFVAQRSSMEHVAPFLFSGIRMILGSVVLFFSAFITDREGTWKNPKLLKSGLLLGIIIYFAGNLQQVGLVFTTAGKTGFITALYIIIVPLLGVFMKSKIKMTAWFGVVLATVGLYLLCMKESFTIEFGDFIVLIGSFFWAFHILCMDYFAPKLSVVRLVSIQFFVAGVLSFITMPFADPLMAGPTTWESMRGAIPAILYVGIGSTAIAATFQGLGQRHAKPVTASIILSTEAVFGAICGYFFLHEVLTSRELTGCILMFAAIVIVQVSPVRSKDGRHMNGGEPVAADPVKGRKAEQIDIKAEQDQNIKQISGE